MACIPWCFLVDSSSLPALFALHRMICGWLLLSLLSKKAGCHFDNGELAVDMSICTTVIHFFNYCSQITFSWNNFGTLPATSFLTPDSESAWKITITSYIGCLLKFLGSKVSSTFSHSLVLASGCWYPSSHWLYFVSGRRSSVGRAEFLAVGKRDAAGSIPTIGSFFGESLTTPESCHVERRLMPLLHT